jgi:hypothetical protein
MLIGGLRALTGFGITWRREGVNGQPGAMLFDREGRLIGVMVLDVAEGQIQGVSGINNPDKLRHLGPLADLDALLHAELDPSAPGLEPDRTHCRCHGRTPVARPGLARGRRLKGRRGTSACLAASRRSSDRLTGRPLNDQGA